MAPFDRVQVPIGVPQFKRKVAILVEVVNFNTPSAFDAPVRGSPSQYYHNVFATEN